MSAPFPGFTTAAASLLEDGSEARARGSREYGSTILNDPDTPSDWSRFGGITFPFVKSKVSAFMLLLGFRTRRCLHIQDTAHTVRPYNATPFLHT